jgi:hypothetical protein
MHFKLPNVSCKYGAPMGRPNVLPEDRNAKVKLRLVRLQWIDHDYDQGGAYWGNPGGSSIFWATDGATDVFVRAKSRVEAKAQVLQDLPNARFYR